MNRIINVLIKDGERTVNWDFPQNQTLKYVLGRFRFEPIRGTLKVGGKEILNPEGVYLSDCPMEIINCDGEPKLRVRVTLESVKKQAKKTVTKKVVPFSAMSVEGTADVR